MNATPWLSSLSTAVSQTVTGELYQPGRPVLPESTIVEVGAIVSGGGVPALIFTTKASSPPLFTGCRLPGVAQLVEFVYPATTAVPVSSTATAWPYSSPARPRNPES